MINYIFLYEAKTSSIMFILKTSQCDTTMKVITILKSTDYSTEQKSSKPKHSKNSGTAKSEMKNEMNETEWNT